jgi:DNA repair protein RadC
VLPREVFKAALLASAATIVLARKHPSGDATPSPDDMARTRRLVDAGRLLGVDVLDHIVIGESRYEPSRARLAMRCARVLSALLPDLSV